MRGPLTLASALFLATMTAGCTPLQWERPGFGPGVAQADWDECSRAAYGEAQREAFTYGYWGPPGYWRRGYGGRAYFVFDPFWPHYGGGGFLREAELRDFCLRSRSYRLVPVPAPPPAAPPLPAPALPTNPADEAPLP